MVPSCGHQRSSAVAVSRHMAHAASNLPNGDHPAHLGNLDVRCDHPLLDHHASAQLLELPRWQCHDVMGVVLAIAGGAVAVVPIEKKRKERKMCGCE
ncbi:unnamed protein product [Urochloa humidicola]